MSEPPYGSYDPYVFTQSEEQIAKQEFWQWFDTFLTDAMRAAPITVGAVNELVNLLSYASDLGPDAATEAAIVDQYLRTFGVPAVVLAPVPAPSTAGLSLPDITVPITDLPGVTVTAPRESPIAAPLVNPTLVSPGLEPGTLPAISPATGLAPLPGYGLAPAPLIGVTPAPGYIAPVSGLGPDPTLANLADPAASPQPQPEPQAGTEPNQTDCQATNQKNKKKKGKKKTRNVCWKGTYEERKSGLLKFRRERIPCR